MHNKISFSLFIIYFALLLSISPGHAQTQEKSQNTATILTQDELEQCLQRSAELTQHSVQLKKHSTQLQTLTDKVKQLELKRENTAVDFHSKQSVDGYNQLNREIKALGQQYNTDAMDFNQQVKQYKMDTEQLKRECDNKKYYQ